MIRTKWEYVKIVHVRSWDGLVRMHVCSFICSFICFIYFTKGKERRKYFNHGGIPWIEDINDNKPFSMSIKVEPACLSSQVRSWLIQSVKKKLSSASFLHISFDLCLTKDGQHRSSVSNTLSGSDFFIQESVAFWFDWKNVNWYVKINSSKTKNGHITLIYRP